MSLPAAPPTVRIRTPSFALLRWSLRIALLVLLVGGFFLWKALGGQAGLAIDEDLAQQAIEDGTSSQEVRLEPPVDWEPNTLSQVRAIHCEEELEVAREALAQYVADHPDAGAGHILLAEVLRRLHRIDAAQAEIELGLGILPTAGPAHFVHARILAKQMEELYERGGAMGKLKATGLVQPYRDALLTTIELDPENVDARKEEILFLLLAPGVGDKPLAIEKARALREVNAMEGDLTLARALYYSSKDDEIQAQGLAAAEKAIEDYPESMDPQWVLGSLLFDEKRYDEADVVLRKVIDHGAADETYYQALYRRMRVRTRQDKEPEQVLKYVVEYLEADPCWEWAPRLHQVYCEQGRALVDLGRNQEAREAFEKSLELNPYYKRAKKSLAALED